MVDIAHEFERIKIKVYDCESGYRYFDPIRKVFLCMTPEELVRQKMIVYLHEKMGADLENVFVEDHLVHYGVEDVNGRIDISLLKKNNEPLAVIECKEPNISIRGLQVYTQAVKYAEAIQAPYLILVNGIELAFYKLIGKVYEPIEGLLTYDEMLGGAGKTIEYKASTRLTMEQYYDLEFLRKQEWYELKIGDDTEELMIPAIMNLNDCLMDETHKLNGMLTNNIEIMEDLGVGFLNYNDASGGGFGSGYYRLLLLNDIQVKKQFTCGFTILATGKMVNDSKYGNRDSLTVLVVSRNDGDYDEMSVQINLNKFLKFTSDKIILTHNAVVTRKGATKQAAIAYIKSKAPDIIKEDKVYLGEVGVSNLIYMDNPDMKKMIGSLVEYSIYRDEYKHQL
ncbi:MAG: type I restriction enzyme HsdR N-terminal domain-containing protein [Candidatus Avilachnospira sp.]